MLHRTTCLARLYAHHRFFDEGTEALFHLLPPLGGQRGDVQRLCAEVSCGREHGEQLPWIF